MKPLEEQIVLITGAGRGAGRTLAKTFAAQGAQVCVNDISPLNVEALADEIVAEGGRGRAYIVDIAKKMSAQALINEVTDDFGRIDILINAAEVNPRGTFLNLDEWDLARTVQVNLLGAFLMTQSVGRIMRAQGEGLILNLAFLKDSERIAYLASKFGLIGFTQQAARELAAASIRINLLGSGLAALATHHTARHDVSSAALAFANGAWQEASGWLVNLTEKES